MADKKEPAGRPKVPGQLWKRVETERNQRIGAASARLQDVILGAWRPELVAAHRQGGA